jgi:hypothetical protein
MSILKNAVDSISLGIEDFQSEDQRRLISCTRNLFAGVLLLFKHRLVQMSPAGSDEVLIKQHILPVQSGNQLEWQGQGTKTVDVQQIRERFKSLGIKVDWSRIDRINKYRNDVEHYFSNLSHSAVRVLITDCFVVIRDFIRQELCLDPIDVLAPEVWRAFTEVAEVYQKEKDDCTAHVEAVDWKYAVLTDALSQCSCPNCGSGLLDTDPNCKDRDDAEFTCLSCRNTYSFEILAERALGEFFANANHRSMKDGGDPVTIDCPNCGKDTYLLKQDVCVMCEESAPRICDMCGCDIPSSEIDGGGLCGYCSHMMSKDD